MQRLVLVILILIVATGFAYSQCSESDSNKILLVGDSWAFYMDIDQTINNVFDKWGHSNYEYLTNGTLAENGAETDDFIKQAKQDEIEKQLNDNPSIEAVHLSIGGNDVLNEWNVNTYSAADVDTLQRNITHRLDSIIRHIKSVRPDIDILWSGYVYPNFEEVIEDSAPFQENHPFYGRWEDMGFPSFYELNTLLNDFSDEVEAYTDTVADVHFVDATGLMQYTFGQTDSLGVPPGGTYPAKTAPLPEGYLNYPSPKESMRDYGVTKDCFHLSPKGYSDLLSYHTRKFYHKFLMDDVYLLAQDSTRDGSVSSQGQISDSLMVGEMNGNSYSSHLTFNTMAMADTTLDQASLLLRIDELTGGNPLNDSMAIKLVNGHFGPSINVEAADVNAFADTVAVPCQFGSDEGKGHWVRLDLPSSTYPYIKNDSSTQFLLSSIGSSNKRVRFSDGSNPDFAPVLNLDYKTPNQDTAVAIRQPSIDNPGLSVSPNPTTGRIKLKTESSQVEDVKVFSLLGKRVLTPSITDNQIDLSPLSKGVYILKVTSDGEQLTQKIVKR